MRTIDWAAATLPVRMQGMGRAAVLAGALVVGACNSDDTPVGPARSVASVAQSAGDARITTSVDAFAGMLEQVNYRNQVLVSVRSSSVAPLDRNSVLAAEAAAHWVLLLPAASETAPVRRAFTGGFASASPQDVEAVVSALRAHGATAQALGTTLPVIAVTFPGEDARRRAALVALAGHPNFDFAEPDEPREASPRGG